MVAWVMEPEVKTELVVAGRLMERPAVLLEDRDLETESRKRCRYMATIPTRPDDRDASGHVRDAVGNERPRAQVTRVSSKLRLRCCFVATIELTLCNCDWQAARKARAVFT